jgi:hypothetical protein
MNGRCAAASAGVSNGNAFQTSSSSGRIERIV